jgi:hypothetical protein
MLLERFIPADDKTANGGPCDYQAFFTVTASRGDSYLRGLPCANFHATAEIFGTPL